ncbi:hypothetical protein K402DRAFT_387753 [Aulographum hederae CBS 113979]|uniref:C2H2-type domain-containing protein n=1 Tax=Aulographum hederae CBS 113979 TaxID=1176131 RepID=A0A6G1GIU5_9PEZI|nr:hypothetical protein K402DRAFT_387753 [Aulographum hederae CBS 113979]
MPLQRRAVSLEDEDISPEYYTNLQNNYDHRIHAKKDYAPNTNTMRSYITKKWIEYHDFVKRDHHAALIEFSPSILNAFWDWFLKTRQPRISSSRTIQTYWNTLCMIYYETSGESKIDLNLKHQMEGIRATLAKKYGLAGPGDVNEEKEKELVRVEELFLLLFTLWCSDRVKFKHERMRAQIALVLVFLGISGNRPNTVLKMTYRDIKFLLLDKGHGKSNFVIRARYTQTKRYLGKKLPNTQTYPTIPQESCLLLCPQTLLLGLAFADNALHNQTEISHPKDLSCIRIPQGLGQQEIPWDEDKLDTFIFRRMESVDGVWRVSDNKPLTLSTLENVLKTLGEISGFSCPVKPYCFRRAGGESLNMSSEISAEQQNLIMGHHDSSTFQKNYLSTHITADTQAAYRGLASQPAVMRSATSIKRTLDPRRPIQLDTADKEEVAKHQEVRKAWRAWQAAKASDNNIQEAKREYLRVRQRHLREKKQEKRRNFNKEQPALDIQKQLKGLPINIPSVVIHIADHKLPQRQAVVEALLKSTCTSVETGISMRTRAISTIADLCNMRERWLPGRRAAPLQIETRKSSYNSGETSKPEEESDQDLPLVCKPTQCLRCLGDWTMSKEDREYQFFSGYELERHRKMHDEGFVIGSSCPHPACAEEEFAFPSLKAYKAHAARYH